MQMRHSCVSGALQEQALRQGGAGGYQFSEDQAQRIFEELFGSGFGGLGGGLGGGMGGRRGAAGPSRVHVFSSGPGGGGGGQPA